MKKIFTILFAASMLASINFAQTQSASSLKKAVKSTKTLKEVKREFDEKWKDKNVEFGYYFENGVKKKAAGWKPFKRQEYYWEQRVNQQTSEFPKTNSIIEYNKYKESIKSLEKSNAYNESWTNLGTNSSLGGYAGIGRINCIEFHPSDNNTFWVGSPSGGIWKTTDGGSSWTVLNDDQDVIGVSDIAIPSDYESSNTLYIATGDRDGGSMWSLSGGQSADNITVGILKSTDGGSTWNTTGLTFAKNVNEKIYKLLIHPSNNSILIASTSDGIYRSTDAGESWTQRNVNSWIDMEFNTADPNNMIATSIGYGDSYIATSTDNGATWGGYATIGSGGYRGELAVTADNSSTVYLLISNISGGLAGVYKSTNSGASFSRADDGTKSMFGYYSDGSGVNEGQGTYDICIAVSPSDENTVYIGGVNTWKSTDGGSTWTINNMWTSSGAYNFSSAPVVHADKHCLEFQSSSVLFEGNDGGIYKTTNGGTSWNDLTNGMVISQLYRIGVSQTSSNTVLAGLQDNGSKLMNSGTWSDVKGGDGMECIVDYSSPTYMYATYVRGQISRSTNGGLSFPTNISANIPGGQPTGAWVTPYIIDPNSSTTLFAGYDVVWKTTDRGNTWSSVSQSLSSSDKLRSIAIAPSNSNVLYTADRTNMWKTTDGGSTNWSSVTLPASTDYLTYIAVKDDDPNTLWITFGGYTAGSKVYESTDGGSNWTNISNGLPNLPVMCIVHYTEATDRNVLFVGTDVGVYIKDGANDWESYNAGLPNVVVTELEVFYNEGANKLIAGTFGRGLWETEISTLLPVELTSFTAMDEDNSVILNWVTKTETNNYGFEIQRKLADKSVSDWAKIGFISGQGNTSIAHNYTFKDKNIENGNYSYRLKQIDVDGQFHFSETIEIAANSAPASYELLTNYPNPFNPTTTISYRIKEQGQVQLIIYDMLGREVETLVNEVQPEGFYTVNYDAGNLASGVYIYTLKANKFIQNKKMTLMK